MFKISINKPSIFHGILFKSVAIISLVFIISACSDATQTTEDNTTLTPLNTLTAEEQQAGWELLFDGKSLSGWRGLGRDEIPEGHWVVEDNAIKKVASDNVERAADGQPIGGGDILYDRKFGNYELQFEWKVSSAGNSGIKYNVSEELSTASEPQYAALGFEYQVLDNDLHPDADNDPNRLAAGLYDLIQPGSYAELNPVGSWNTGRIVFNGNRGEHWLNGTLAVEYELGTYMMDRLLQTSKYGNNDVFGIRRNSGYIVLQDHGDDVWFRNIKVRELNP
ncbi:MAG: DUF1080 domain-containing protein [Balneolales bacterium]